MRSKFLWLLLLFVSCTQVATLSAAQSPQTLQPLPAQPQAAHISAEVLTRYHYRQMPLDDHASSLIFDHYLKALDSEKLFFVQADIDRFSVARTRLDDAILNENLNIPFAMHNLLQQRIVERLTYARALLKNGFDFERQESMQISREKAPWAQSVEELNDLWRKRVKSDWLRLKLAGKDDKSIAETLDKRYETYLNSTAKVKSDDVFQSFMNAYATSIDPHTNYFGVRASEDFDISMRLSMVGIGAVLEQKDDLTTIRELVAGSPAALSGKLNVGDRIVGVGQGENSTPVDVTGWRLDDTVAKIRGAEDSVVVLDILPAEAGVDGKHKLVTLIRKKISLEKQAAKKSMIEIQDGASRRRIGVIELPVFYQDFAARQKGDKDYRSASRDVTRLIGELKQEQVDGILIDLRNNGGGSLDEAVELTGLFIDQGPVVQQRDADGKVTVTSDTNPGVAWSGPMGVLINRASASASEIFAAAIQDYGRGVVIGELSYGKGTVQSVVNLDQLTKKAKPELGEVKMTIAQFFRINGGTTQLRGVTPDISMPTMTDVDDFGESSYDNALPWTHIQPASYLPFCNLALIVPNMAALHQDRINKDQDFGYLREDIVEMDAQRKKNLISLNEADRRQDRAAQEAKAKSREKAGDTHSSSKFQDDGLQANERNLSDDLALEKARKDRKDIILNEAAHIVSDEIGMLKQHANP